MKGTLTMDWSTFLFVFLVTFGGVIAGTAATGTIDRTRRCPRLIYVGTLILIAAAVTVTLYAYFATADPSHLPTQ